MDCATATIGLGAGCKIMMGPLNTGMIVTGDVLGYRDGVKIFPNYITTNTFMLPIGPLFPSMFYDEARYGIDVLPVRTASQANYVNHYPLMAKLKVVPAKEGIYHANQYYTQIEITGGIILTIRLGINVGEMLDLICGFWGKDLYDDDLYPYKSLPEKIKKRKL